MRQEVLIGVERRRRWSVEQKLRIVGEAGAAGARVSDVARRHDITRQHIYQWRREMRRKGIGFEERPVFLPVSVEPPDGVSRDGAESHPAARHGVEIRLRNGRSVCVDLDVPEPALKRMLRIAEEA